jgi:cell division protein YceG involved in septum cleavage
LVAQAFIDNPNNLPDVNHKNGNKLDNYVENLEWVTKSENSIHAFKTGLHKINGYTRYKVSKKARRFSDEEVEEMRKLFKEGYTKKEIAQKFKCADSVVGNILNRRYYNQIELTTYDLARLTIDYLNELREKYLETKDKKYWYQIIQLLPCGYNQKRTIQLNYEVLANMYKSRRNHKLDEWRDFCIWIETLPYSELITGGNV